MGFSEEITILFYFLKTHVAKNIYFILGMHSIFLKLNSGLAKIFDSPQLPQHI